MTRRKLFELGLLAPAMNTAAAPTPPPCDGTGKKKIAAIVTEYRYNSHADVLIGRLMAGYSANGVWTPPLNHVVSLFADQTPANDQSRDLAARNGFRIYPTIREALTLGGGTLAVDGVVFVGEHGNYPLNDVGQKMYPRHRLFSQILDVYEQSGRSVPTLFDKHFSYSWDQADEMYRRAKKLGFPFMAGSSIPVTVRQPAMDPPLDAPITEAVSIGYADPDAYGFHTIEGLQCMVERRKGGETGIRSVQWIQGGDVWKWRDSERGSWSKPLLEEAARMQSRLIPGPLESTAKDPVLFVFNYIDGLKGASLVLTHNSANFSVAMRVKGQDTLLSTLEGGPTGRPLPNWDGFARCVDLLMATGQTTWPAERTLLTTGALSFCFESKRQGGKEIETPQLKINYRAPAHSWFQTA
jgi:hypothetical protein